eukprot:TRINITY_DN7031_c0_g5_i2.p2 TRINITY_DN7031_c0_g5~~TRINITY_DN7031_c0_g5_i2.p2  ORF type:complete len:269 (-),score=-13.53 TRINITY_DN7031_c0_g5_i2:74-880(-)
MSSRGLSSGRGERPCGGRWGCCGLLSECSRGCGATAIHRRLCPFGHARLALLGREVEVHLHHEAQPAVPTISTAATEIAKATTNPDGASGWIAADGRENADLCAGEYGNSTQTHKGSSDFGIPYGYNLVGDGGLRFMVQMNFDLASKQCQTGVPKRTEPAVDGGGATPSAALAQESAAAPSTAAGAFPPTAAQSPAAHSSTAAPSPLYESSHGAALPPGADNSATAAPPSKPPPSAVPPSAPKPAVASTKAGPHVPSLLALGLALLLV